MLAIIVPVLALWAFSWHRGRIDEHKAGALRSRLMYVSVTGVLYHANSFMAESTPF